MNASPVVAAPTAASRGFGIVGASAENRIALCLALVSTLTRRGLRVAVLLSAPEGFDLDKPGKDSFEHRAAGASEVMISSEKRWALMHENDAETATAAAVTQRMAAVDLLLLEGEAAGAADSIVICRPEDGFPRGQEGHIVALVSTTAQPEIALPTFQPDDAEAMADFIIEHCVLRCGAARRE